MDLSSLKARWNGVSGRSKVVILMAAAAIGVAAATPWLFDDGTVEQSNLSRGRAGVKRNASTTVSNGKSAERPADPATGSPLPVPGSISGLFDGAKIPQLPQTQAAGDGAETGAPEAKSVAGVDESDVSFADGRMSKSVGRGIGVQRADFGNGVKGFVARPKR